jgi:hypothetical protein
MDEARAGGRRRVRHLRGHRGDRAVGHRDEHDAIVDLGQPLPRRHELGVVPGGVEGADQAAAEVTPAGDYQMLRR